MNSVALEMPEVHQECYPDSSFTWFDISTDPPGWDALARATTPSIFQLRSLLLAHSHGCGHPVGVVFRRLGRPPIAIGGLLRTQRGRRRFKVLSFPALVETQEPGLVGALIDWLQTQQVTDIQIGSFMSGAEGYHRPAGAVACERLEFVWTIRESAEQRFRALRSNHRRHLQKLLKMNLVLGKIGNWQPERMTWLRIQWSRRRRLAMPLRQLLQMYRYHRLLQRTLTSTNIGQLYGIYDDRGTLLSAAYMLELDGVAFYMLGASSKPGYSMNASLRLFWDLAERYADQGFGQLHLGGVPAEAASKTHAEHGVFRFKAGFGIEPISRMSVSIKNEE